MKPPKAGSFTPWGWADDAVEKAAGIIMVTTPGHGGFWLSPDRLATVKAKFPDLKNTFAGFPWFEEDCDWALVALTFPELFPATVVASAEKMKAWMDARKNR